MLRTLHVLLTTSQWERRIWNGATLAAYIYMIQGNSNKSVGIAEGIFGTFCAAAGLPAGWLADHCRRDRTLRVCSVIMLGGHLPTNQHRGILPERRLSRCCAAGGIRIGCCGPRFTAELRLSHMAILTLCAVQTAPMPRGVE